ncbi:MAG: hypothetical protein QOJ12_2394 [Thermoleophilales bacterium]|nr:hypothetical protein [Thermoleophilales bacterium]
MATFDQLPADQRAIIELVVKRGRTYDSLSDMLGMPTTRVRELAQDALTQLAPHTADRVDPDWRAQVADYALGQQSGPESAATQGHLRRSEAARSWLLSLMDSLDQLYANGSRPEIPEPETGRARDRKAGRDRSAAAVVAPTLERDEERTRETKAAEPTKPTPTPTPAASRDGGPLSPAAREIVKRRRIIGAVAGVAAVILAVLLVTGTFSGGGSKSSNASSNAKTSTTAKTPTTTLVGQLQLNPVGPLAKKDTAGYAAIAVTGNKPQVAVRAKLPPSGQRAYEVWLYNTKTDALSVGAQRTDAQGNYEGAAPIPSDWQKYKYIDISLEDVDNNRAHSGRSILRGALANLQAAPPAQQGGTATTPGTGTTPGTTTAP